MITAFVPNFIWNGLFFCPRRANKLPKYRYFDKIYYVSKATPSTPMLVVFYVAFKG